ncbi:MULTISPECIES: hypothetical protein [unclassified Aeromicrobium]|uniref:hypothetical protein n=1 Tax=unclassified Aeromicrobium TaxID=2633570 RepID=UPI00288AAE00|nr:MULTISPECIES: hypothetical protein [unclassified Aeromicrobium]
MHAGTLTIDCPGCDEGIAVELEVERVLLVDVETNEPSTATLVFKITDNAQAALAAHGCFEVTDEDRAQLAAFVESLEDDDEDDRG